MKVFVLYLSLLTHLLSGAGSAEGVVLCFEADGQVVVEYSRNGTCCSSSAVQVSSRSSSLVKSSSVKDHCGTCWDIPILLIGSERPFILTQNSLPPLEPVFVLLALFPISTLQEVAREGSLLQYSPPPTSTLLLHRTVILLI